jgi:hypothetical protein
MWLPDGRACRISRCRVDLAEEIAVADERREVRRRAQGPFLGVRKNIALKWIVLKRERERPRGILKLRLGQRGYFDVRLR